MKKGEESNQCMKQTVSIFSFKQEWKVNKKGTKWKRLKHLFWFFENDLPWSMPINQINIK